MRCFSCNQNRELHIKLNLWRTAPISVDKMCFLGRFILHRTSSAWLKLFSVDELGRSLYGPWRVRACLTIEAQSYLALRSPLPFLWNSHFLMYQCIFFHLGWPPNFLEKVNFHYFFMFCVWSSHLSLEYSAAENNFNNRQLALMMYKEWKACEENGFTCFKQIGRRCWTLR